MPIFVSAQNGQAFKSRAFARSPRIGWIHVKKAIPRSGRLLEFVERQYLAGSLGTARVARFRQQSVALALKVRPIVVLGDRVPFKDSHTNRVAGSEFRVRVTFHDWSVKIDGNGESSRGSGQSVLSGLGDTGSFESSVQCRSVGKHEMVVTLHVEVDQLGNGSVHLLFENDLNVSATFEVVAQPPTGNFDLVTDPHIGELIHAKLRPKGVALGTRDRDTLEAGFDIAPMPTGIAFDVFARLDGHETRIGKIVCLRNSPYGVWVSNKVIGIGSATRPATVDLVLRSNEILARQTLVEYGVWSGELTYPDVPIGINPNR